MNYDASNSDELGREVPDAALADMGGKAGITGLTRRSLGEMEELELTAELLGVSSERELEQLFHLLSRRVSNRTSRRLSAPAALAILSVLRFAINKSGLTDLRARVGAHAVFAERTDGSPGELLGMELEGLSAEDREFQTARRLVRFAGAAVAQAAAASGRTSSWQATEMALEHAARGFAPGLVRMLSMAAARHAAGCGSRQDLPTNAVP